MDLSEFNERYLGPLMEKLTNENKKNLPARRL